MSNQIVPQGLIDSLLMRAARHGIRTLDGEEQQIVLRATEKRYAGDAPTTDRRPVVRRRRRDLARELRKALGVKQQMPEPRVLTARAQ